MKRVWTFAAIAANIRPAVRLTGLNAAEASLKASHSVRRAATVGSSAFEAASGAGSANWPPKISPITVEKLEATPTKACNIALLASNMAGSDKRRSSIE